MLKVVQNVQSWPDQGLGSNPVTTEPYNSWGDSYKNNQLINKPQQKALLLEDLKVSEKSNYFHKCTALCNLRRRAENITGIIFLQDLYINLDFTALWILTGKNK